MMPMVRQAPLLAVLAIALCGTAAAQPVAASAPATPAFLAGVETASGRIERLGGGIVVIMPTERWSCEDDGFCGGSGREFQVSVGAGGWRLAGGRVGMAYPFWVDALVTLTRTRPGVHGDRESTYVGGEVSIAISGGEYGSTLLSLKPSIGLARRIQGTSGPRGTLVTWGIGCSVLWSKYR